MTAAAERFRFSPVQKALDSGVNYFDTENAGGERPIFAAEAPGTQRSKIYFSVFLCVPGASAVILLRMPSV